MSYFREKISKEDLATEETEIMERVSVAKSSLDQKIVNIFGRVPSSILIGGVAGAVVELIIRISRYGYDYDDIYVQLDNIVRYLSPSFRAIAIDGAFGGMIVGAVTGGITKGIKRGLVRGGIGIIAGAVTRVIAELIYRSATERLSFYSLDYVLILFNQLILAGAIVGLSIGLLPLSKKRY